MRKSLPFLFLIFIWPASVFAQIELNGNIEDDVGRPVAETRIGVAAGPSDITDSIGQFKIKLSLDFIEGERIIIEVFKKDWWINHPLDGEWNLPNIKYQNVHKTKVIIVPKSSKKLWTHARIEKHIAELSDELAKMKKEGEKPLPVDFTYYLSEWAEKYGFSHDEVKEQFDQWTREASRSAGKRTRALAEYYNKNFKTAAKLFDEAADNDDAELEKIEEERRLKILSSYTNRKDAGNSFSVLYMFREALGAYQKAQMRVKSKSDFPQEWAEISVLIGNTKVSLGERVEGDEANKYLSEAVELYQNVLEVYTRQDRPQEWAKTQNNLGIAFNIQGGRAAGNVGVELLKKSVHAFEDALNIFTKEDRPQQWAMTQNNLGVVYFKQGMRATIYKGTELLKKSVHAFEDALEVIKKKDQPQLWANSQNNLGSVLSELGNQTAGYEGNKIFEKSVQAFENALDVFTKEDQPQQWAMTRNNLGLVYLNQGMRTTGHEKVKIIEFAVQAFNDALKVLTREDLPLGWAKTQRSLGNTYANLKDWRKAVILYTNVLEIDPNSKEMFQKASYIYHERLFDFPKAYDLNASWIKRHPYDLSARIDFVEKQFTTARFNDSLNNIAFLRANPSLDSGQKIVLRTIEIADLVAVGGYELIQSRLEALQARVSAEPANFRVSWTSQGTTHFISQYEPLTLYRKWLLTLIHAMEGENRGAILSSLQTVAEQATDLFEKQ